MEGKAQGTGTFGPGTAGMTLQQAVFAGLVDPGNLVNVREIVDNVTATPDCGSVSPVNCDTSVYSGPRAQYTITNNADGSTTVVDTTSAPPAVGVVATGDGTDTLFHVDRLQFADQTVILGNPGAPTAVSAARGNASATVSWTAPANTGATPLTGFQVDVRTGTTVVRTVSVTPGTANSTVITGLTNGTAYNFVVRAVNSIGAGPDSGPSNTVTPAAVPGAPTNVTATAGNAQATVSWTPGANNGSAVTGFSVQVLNAANVQQGALRPAGAAATSLVVTGLTNGTTYHFVVTATSAIGTGPGGTSNAVTPTAPNTAPSAPGIGVATAGNASATVRWTVPASNGGSAITGYNVQVLNAANVQVGALRPAGAAATSLVVTGLTNGTTYHFTVTATNAIGTSVPSASSNNVTPATVPGAPTIGAATSGTPGGAVNATARWTAPAATGGSAITGYRVTALRFTNAADTTPNATVVSAVQGAGVRTLTMTLPAGFYRFTVQAINAVGGSAQSARSNLVQAR